MASSSPQRPLPSCPTYHRVWYLFFEFWTKEEDVHWEVYPKLDPGREGGGQEAEQLNVMSKVISTGSVMSCF